MNKYKALNFQSSEKFYPVQIHRIDEPDQTYYFVYFVDFGASVCSATGDTIEEALETLDKVKNDVITYLVETGKPVPEPSINPFDRPAPTFIGEALKDVKQCPRCIADHLSAVFPMFTVDDIFEYLENKNHLWRSILLSCMADRDYQILSSALRYFLLTFLVGEDRDLAKSAALALHASGGSCKTSLYSMIRERSLTDIYSLIQFVEYNDL